MITTSTLPLFGKGDVLLVGELVLGFVAGTEQRSYAAASPHS
jgi:hypothetical protein